MLKKNIPNGVIIYQGPSLIDGKPIVVIANSLKVNKNRKIGNMIQTWILRTDIHPNDALKSGDDISICGDCMHRGVYDEKTDTVKNRTCYVNLYKQGVFSIYNAFKRGSYPVCDIKHMQLFNDRHIRIGSYGDPAAVPLYVWETITKFCKDFTGYTHAWRTCDSGYSKFCMASCETVSDAMEVGRINRGEKGDIKDGDFWRTFRVRKEVGDLIYQDERQCPAQVNDKIHCDKCGICDGFDSNRYNDNRKSLNITVVFHGSCGRKEQYLKKLELLNA
jgi:hypothetical protein